MLEDVLEKMFGKWSELKSYKSSYGQLFNISYYTGFSPPPTANKCIMQFEVRKANNNCFRCSIGITSELQSYWKIPSYSDDVKKVLVEIAKALIEKKIESCDFHDFEITLTQGDMDNDSIQKESIELTIQAIKKNTENIVNRVADNNEHDDILDKYPFEDPNSRKEFRSKLLKIIYDISKGQIGCKVSRRNVIEVLEISNILSPSLLSTYEYLESKGFLKYENPMEDSITIAGVDEIENYSNIHSMDTTSLKVYIDDISSFNAVKSINTQAVNELMPLGLDEDYIQSCLEKIINEPFHKNDWGGETNDLYTTRIEKDAGKRISAAFMLKGKGLKSKLTIKNCGKNGDQIVRLFESPAEIFFIQHIGEISEEVIKDAEGKAELLRRRGKLVYCCFIDGYDIARILKAYKMI